MLLVRATLWHRHLCRRATNKNMVFWRAKVNEAFLESWQINNQKKPERKKFHRSTKSSFIRLPVAQCQLIIHSHLGMPLHPTELDLDKPHALEIVYLSLRDDRFAKHTRSELQGRLTRSWTPKTKNNLRKTWKGNDIDPRHCLFSSLKECPTDRRVY